MTLRLIVLCALAACGADSASTPPPAAPKPAPAPVPVAPTDQCRRACEYQASCLPAAYRDHDPNDCLADCRANLESRNLGDPSERPKVWADCLTALPCSAIVKSMAMDEGPAGYCYSKAIH